MIYMDLIILSLNYWGKIFLYYYFVYMVKLNLTNIKNGTGIRFNFVSIYYSGTYGSYIFY